ncbi:MAG: threonine--tRNA ligase [Planctomycetes bacterium]|nr:threonine--tRNA ligase [Planctomycetota bacterium]
MNETIKLTLPDGSVREVPAGTTGLELAAGIGKGLAKAAVAIKVDGHVRSLQLPIDTDATVEIVTRDTPEGLHVIRHSAAHVLADAVKRLRPHAKLWKGPAIDDPRFGFYYDIDVGDEPLSNEDLPKLEELMRQIVASDVPFVYEERSREDAKRLMAEHGEVYKLATIAKIPDGEVISFYHSGDFVDLCEGPHVPSTGRIGKGIAVLSLAGAHFEGDAGQKMLTRVYGHAFADEKSMAEHRHKLEEAQKRDHRRLGIDLDLFSTMGEFGAGLVLWHPKGGFVRHKMEEFWRQEHLKGGYDIVYTPHVARSDLWRTSGHLDFYADSMFKGMDVDGADYLLKPMNCPFHVQIYKSTRRSYRDLPFRWAELGTVYRYEEAGALHGLMRVRGFTQDDAHLFVRPDQLDAEIDRVLAFILHILRSFGFEQFEMNLSTKPEKSVGDPKDWATAEAALRKALEKSGLPFEIDEGGGAFYGPKIDVKIRDSLGRSWQCSTLQLDFNLPERFDLTFVDHDGERRRPFMLHRALLGSLERFFGILIEHFGGAFPVWLAPVQAVLLSVGERHGAYAEKVAAELRERGFRVDADCGADKIGAKIRHHLWQQKVPMIAVCGDQEVEHGTLAVRDRRDGELGALTPDQLAERLAELERTRA